MSLSLLYNVDPRAVRQKLYYIGNSTVYKGMPLCYNQDTTTNWLGFDKATTSASPTFDNTTAEGYQNEGKWSYVEDPASGNLMWLAGYVADGDWEGKTGPCMVEIYEPNGAIVPVRTNKNCTIGDELGLASGVSYLTYLTGDGDPMPCAIAMETVDRSGTAGLCLAKVFHTGQPLSALGGFFYPQRGITTGDAYGVKIDGSAFFVETGASSRSWLVGISGDKDVAGGNDVAWLRLNGNNYGANAVTCNVRGLNCCISNRDGGVAGELTNIISAQLKDGSTTTKAYALAVDIYDEAATAKTEFGGIDLAICREGTAATTEYGMQIRTRGTINTAMNTVFRLTKDATDHGFINLFNIETDAIDVLAATGDTAHDTSDICLPIVFNGTTYYIVAQDSRG